LFDQIGDDDDRGILGCRRMAHRKHRRATIAEGSSEVEMQGRKGNGVSFGIGTVRLDCPFATKSRSRSG